ncbi:hypothetical protein [Aliarcobacter butzleri]|uniref:hypothetical protein n=1 Tax=Aliarcobacter butzleri TaxID=28197 RepID=UPI00344D33AE
MFKKLCFSLLITSSLLFASETVTVNFQDAITIANNLIKDLYKRIELLEKDISDLKNQKNLDKKVSVASNTNILTNKEYFVSIDGINVRSNPNSSKTNSIGKLNFGDIVICEEIKNEWCNTTNGNYIWMKGLKKIDKKIAIVTKTTELQNFKTLGKTKNIGKLEKGKVIDKIGNIKDWAVLDSSLLVNSNDIMEAE